MCVLPLRALLLSLLFPYLGFGLAIAPSHLNSTARVAGPIQFPPSPKARPAGEKSHFPLFVPTLKSNGQSKLPFLPPKISLPASDGSPTLEHSNAPRHTHCRPRPISTPKYGPFLSFSSTDSFIKRSYSYVSWALATLHIGVPPGRQTSNAGRG